MKKYFTKQKITVCLLCGIVLFAGLWWHNTAQVNTDDAYVNANVIQVAAEVTGQVSKLLIENNQKVTQGQMLFELDPTSFELAVKVADENVQLASLDATKADTQIKTMQNNHKIQLAQANLAQAKLNLEHTHVVAKASGQISDLTLQVGDIVNANQPLFALISDHDFWVDANFKETDLESIRQGQAVDVAVDMYPDVIFKGVVDSISAGSGTAFSLLPPENATGNWVKVAQRVPVKIKILNVDPQKPLRIGTSASVTIHLK